MDHRTNRPTGSKAYVIGLVERLLFAFTAIQVTISIIHCTDPSPPTRSMAITLAAICIPLAVLQCVLTWPQKRP